MGKHILLTFILLLPFQNKSHAQNLDWGNCLNGDIWLLVDTSGSLNGREETLYSAVQTIASKLIQWNPETRVGLWEFPIITNNRQTEDESVLRVDLTRDKEAFNGFWSKGYGNENIAKALSNAFFYHNNTVTKDREEQENYQKILILISDGVDGDNHQRAQSYAQYIKSQGMGIISLHLVTEKASQHSTDINQFMRSISGIPDKTEEAYFQTNLENLAQFFSATFGCH
ncbi:MAG TPA: VWA domain-containing protein [Oligoflexia bacterium]|nr:VWA domain-containing protein [Oligoflexia bacterium]HMR24452.1 VWA domain-containing protein [Oligoflexia bacterium]